MRLFFILFVGCAAVLLATRCSEHKPGEGVTPNSPQPEFIGETGLIHDDSVFYEQPVYWVAAPVNAPIPAKWDVRDNMKATLPAPKNQNCGDCWAWATHHGLEIWTALNKGLVFDYSVQSVLSCSRAGSCGGGYMSAVTFLQKSGLPLESDFPYVGRDVKCKYSADELATGFGNKIIEAPYVGESFEKSRYWKLSGQFFESRDKISQIQQAMVQLNSPAVVTVSAYGSSSNEVVSKCSALNSGGNHMVDVIGWDDESGGPNAHVYNSWGTGHGEKGISRLKWNCDGRLNRGLGVSARVIRGDAKPPCDPPANPNLKPEQVIFLGSKTEIGRDIPNVKCVWSPVMGLKDPNACKTDASPEKSTEYHLEVSNECGKVTAMSYVRVFAPVLTGGGKVIQEETHEIQTPFGTVDRRSGRVQE